MLNRRCPPLTFVPVSGFEPPTKKCSPPRIGPFVVFSLVWNGESRAKLWHGGKRRKLRYKEVNEVLWQTLTT
jgi:hypothetical protein